jgi:hypothetical protein
MTIKQTFSATKVGSLHAFCGVPSSQTIPVGKLKWAARQGRTRRERLLAAKAALVLRIRYKISL